MDCVPYVNMIWKSNHYRVPVDRLSPQCGSNVALLFTLLYTIYNFEISIFDIFCTINRYFSFYTYNIETKFNFCIQFFIVFGI